MTRRKNDAPKKTGVNRGIEKGVATQQFESRVICKKCGKDVEFTLGSELFVRCPRCNKRMERDLKQENKKANRIISLDILRRSKRAQLSLGFFLTVAVLVYNIVGFLTDLFAGGNWWLGLLGIPFIVLSYFLIKGTKTGSASAKYRFYARLALIVNFAVLLVIIATSVPLFADWIREFLGR